MPRKTPFALSARCGAALLTLAFCGALAAAPGADRPRLVAARTVGDLGEVIRGRVEKVAFELRNTGSAPLLVESAKPG